MTTLTWDEIEAPFGPFSFAVLDGAVVAGAYGHGADHVDRWCMVLGARVADRGGHDTVVARRWAERYLADARAVLDVPLDLRLARGFQREVLDTLRGVPLGETVSYGELAEMAGRPGAARAVGGAMARNPVPSRAGRGWSPRWLRWRSQCPRHQALAPGARGRAGLRSPV
jgi:methylated-DNA-[protein]-cysteine S-methyltransferase